MTVPILVHSVCVIDASHEDPTQEVVKDYRTPLVLVGSFIIEPMMPEDFTVDEVAIAWATAHGLPPPGCCFVSSTDPASRTYIEETFEHVCAMLGVNMQWHRRRAETLKQAATAAGEKLDAICKQRDQLIDRLQEEIGVDQTREFLISISTPKDG
jgi:hypothetical protein